MDTPAGRQPRMPVGVPFFVLAKIAFGVMLGLLAVSEALRWHGTHSESAFLPAGTTWVQPSTGAVHVSIPALLAAWRGEELRAVVTHVRCDAATGCSPVDGGLLPLPPGVSSQHAADAMTSHPAQLLLQLATATGMAASIATLLWSLSSDGTAAEMSSIGAVLLWYMTLSQLCSARGCLWVLLGTGRAVMPLMQALRSAFVYPALLTLAERMRAYNSADAAGRGPSTVGAAPRDAPVTSWETLAKGLAAVVLASGARGLSGTPVGYALMAIFPLLHFYTLLPRLVRAARTVHDVFVTQREQKPEGPAQPQRQPQPQPPTQTHLFGSVARDDNRFGVLGACTMFSVAAHVAVGTLEVLYEWSGHPTYMYWFWVLTGLANVPLVAAAMLHRVLVQQEALAVALATETLSRTAELERAAKNQQRLYIRWVFHELRVPFHAVRLGLECLEGMTAPAPVAAGPAGGAAAVGAAADSAAAGAAPARSGNDHASSDPVPSPQEPRAARLPRPALDLAGIQEVLEMVGASADTMATILNSVLELSAIEAESFKMEPRPADVRALVKAVGFQMQPWARAVGGRLLLDVRPDVPALVVCDAVRVGQVLRNFASNGLKWLGRDRDGAGTVTLRVSVTDRPPRPLSARRPLGGDALYGDATYAAALAAAESAEAATVAAAEPSGPTTYVLFEVEDNGCGIAADQVSKLFTPYVQINSGDNAKKVQGTGLGLAISRQLAERMGGRVGVRSAVGMGSTFWFTLPLLLPPPDAAAGRDGAAAGSSMAAAAPAAPANAAAAADGPGARTLTLDTSVADEQMLYDDAGSGSSSASSGTPCHIAPHMAGGGDDGSSTGAGERAAAAADRHVSARELSPARPASSTAAALSPLANLRARTLSRSHGLRATGGCPPTTPQRRATTAVEPADAAAAAVGTVGSESPVPPLPVARLLVCDDEAVGRRLLARLLQRRYPGVPIDQAVNGREAVDLVAARGVNAYAAILMDASMPVMDGLTAVAELRRMGVGCTPAGSPMRPEPGQRGPGSVTRIIGVTGNALAEDQAAFAARGADVVIIKPASIEQLSAAVGDVT